MYRSWLTHRLGLALLLASVALAVAAAFGAPWSGREAWLLALGAAAYGAVAVKVALRKRPALPPAAKAPVAGPGATDILRLTEEALRHMNDPAGLAGCHLLEFIPLTIAAASPGSSPKGVRTPLGQAQVLRLVLVASIEKLKLATEALPPGHPSTLQHLILRDEYVFGRPNNQIITRHSISESTFHRYRREAIRALAADLSAQEALLRDSGPHAQAARDFSSDSHESTAAKEPAKASAPFRTILFTDIQDHTAMMQRVGDAKGREVLREHERITREALRAHGGTEVKTIGDSFMASFPSAHRAVECAIALQRAFDAHSAGVGAQHAAPLQGRVEPITVRIGLNAGEPIADEDDLFGSSVILAARTKEHANGGEILVTEVVRHLVTGKGFSFADRGYIEMKGFEDPVRLYEVHWREDA